MKMYGYDRTTNEVSYKLKNIKCFYNRIKKDIEANNLQSYPWQHYDAVDKILSRPLFKLPNPVPTPPNLNIHHVNEESQKNEPNDINDNETSNCQQKENPVGSLLVCQKENETGLLINNVISDYQIKEEPLDIIDNGINDDIIDNGTNDDIVKGLQVFEAQLNKHTSNLKDDIQLPVSKLVGRKIQINIPKRPTSIQLNVNNSNEVFTSVPSTSYAKEMVTTDATVPSNIIKTIRIPIIPYLSNNACSSKSVGNSTVTASTSSQRPTTVSIQSLSSNNADTKSSEPILSAKLSSSLKQQHELSQHNISILQLNHAKQNPISSTFIQNVIPLLEAEAQTESENLSSSTPENPSQPVPGTSSPSLDKNLTTIMEIENKRLKIECKRLAIEEERLKIELERFEFKKTNSDAVLLLLKSILATKQPT
ncbi:unnamed protein product [Diamesa tonsa]